MFSLARYGDVFNLLYWVCSVFSILFYEPLGAFAPVYYATAPVYAVVFIVIPFIRRRRNRNRPES